MNVLSDKMLKMNNYSTNPKFAEVDSSFNKKSMSYISKQRNKRMLKNRLNQLQQYFPNDFGDKKKESQDDPNNKTQNLEDMDFFNLLKHTGFIKEEKTSNMKMKVLK